MAGTLFWCSLFEILLFAVSMLLFFTHPTSMVWIWIHFPHVIRGTIGFILMKRLPSSHDMAAQMSIPQNDRLPFEKIMEYILSGAYDALSAFTSVTKKWLCFYLVGTSFCLFLDFAGFFGQMHNFKHQEEPFSNLSLILLSVIFLFIDWFYLMWIMSLTFKFPTYTNSAVIKSVFGLAESLHKKLGEKLEARKFEADQRYAVERHKFNYV